MRRLTVATLALVAGFATPVLAQNVQLPADTVIAARQSAFELMAGAFGVMKRAIDAKADVKPFKAAAQGMEAWGKTIPAMFP